MLLFSGGQIIIPTNPIKRKDLHNVALTSKVFPDFNQLTKNHISSSHTRENASKKKKRLNMLSFDILSLCQ
jgi:aryl-alcohol dehydrogenase-like predicted oxidoreductase